MRKIRRIDFSPDEFLAGTIILTDAQLGLYWRACSLIYSTGGPIHVDHLRAVSRSHGNAFRANLDRLFAIGKLLLNGDEIDQIRSRFELEKALNRSRFHSEIGKKGGRPSNNINEVRKASAFRAEKHARAPSTINHQLKDSPPTPSASQNDDGPSAAALVSEFDEFWSLFPRKVAKGQARTAYLKARKKTDYATLKTATIEFSRQSVGKESRFIPHPATWLNAERWLDAPAPPAQATMLLPINGNNRGYSETAGWDNVVTRAEIEEYEKTRDAHLHRTPEELAELDRLMTNYRERRKTS